jgi:hypothetical protein
LGFRDLERRPLASLNVGVGPVRQDLRPLRVRPLYRGDPGGGGGHGLGFGFYVYCRGSWGFGIWVLGYVFGVWSLKFGIQG